MSVADVGTWMMIMMMMTMEKRNSRNMTREDVSWSNIHITNELREGLLVEVFIQHPGQTSAQTTE